MDCITKPLSYLSIAATAVNEAVCHFFSSLYSLFQRMIPKCTGLKPESLEGRVSFCPFTPRIPVYKSFFPSKPQVIQTQNKAIDNPGNNCFMNAFIQDFLGDKERFDWFLAKLAKIANDTTLDKTKNEAAGSSITLLNQWKTSNLSENDSRKLRTSFTALCPLTLDGDAPFSTSNQEDAQEFRLALLDALTELTAVKDDEEGFFDTYSSTEELEQATLCPWIVTTTEFIERANPGTRYYLKNCIATKHTTPPLEHINNKHSSNWEVTCIDQKITKSHEIQIPITQTTTGNSVDIANSCLNLDKTDEGKFGYDPKENHPVLFREVTQSTTWPNTLFLHFILSKYDGENLLKYTKVKYHFSDIKNWTIDLSKAKNPCTYQLQSFVVHSGSRIRSGHYYTIRMEENDKGENQWIKYNDGSITPITNQEAEDFFDGTTGSATPYLMTFKKIPMIDPAESPLNLTNSINH